MYIPQFIRKRFQRFTNHSVEKVQNAKDVLLRGGIITLIFATIISAAIFLYVAFYYTYMPSISHTRPVHLQFKSCDESRGICSFPSAHVQLTKRQQILMVGQPYKMYLHLDMPESPANKELGMFMVCIDLHDGENALVSNSCRLTMLHYRSYLNHILTTLFYSPFMILGSKEEKQTIVLELYNDFEEDQNHRVTDIYVEVQSRHVQLYSAVLHIQAHFTGLRYLMFHWPVFSSIVGISSNLFFIILVVLLSWIRLYQGEEEDTDSSYIYQKSDGDKKDILVLKGETEDSSFDEASFYEEPNKESCDAQDLTEFLLDRRNSSSDC